MSKPGIRLMELCLCGVFGNVFGIVRTIWISMYCHPERPHARQGDKSLQGSLGWTACSDLWPGGLRCENKPHVMLTFICVYSVPDIFYNNGRWYNCFSAPKSKVKMFSPGDIQVSTLHAALPTLSRAVRHVKRRKESNSPYHIPSFLRQFQHYSQRKQREAF